MESFHSNRNRHILSGLKKGNTESFELIYKTLQPKLIAFSYRYLKVYEDAEGLVQEVFVELWKNRQKIDVNLSVSSFLFTITRNKIIDYFRKKKRQDLYNNYLRSYLDTAYHLTENTDSNDNNKKLNRIIKSLPEKRKQVFLLSKKFDLSRKEIAGFLNISENTVKNHLQEAMRTIKQTLHKENVLTFLYALILFKFH